MDSKDALWAMQPQETSLAFRAFNKYVHMLDDPAVKRRSLHRLAKEMGYADEKALENWSASNNWVERARYYDSYHAVAIVQREVQDLGAFQAHVVESLTEQLTVLDAIINSMLKAIVDDDTYTDGEDAKRKYSPSDIKRVVETIKLKDDLMRRVAKLPTTYLSEGAEETETQMTYILGGE